MQVIVPKASLWRALSAFPYSAVSPEGFGNLPGDGSCLQIHRETKLVLWWPLLASAWRSPQTPTSFQYDNSNRGTIHDCPWRSPGALAPWVLPEGAAHRKGDAKIFSAPGSVTSTCRWMMDRCWTWLFSWMLFGVWEMCTCFFLSKQVNFFLIYLFIIIFSSKQAILRKENTLTRLALKSWSRTFVFWQVGGVVIFFHGTHGAPLVLVGTRWVCTSHPGQQRFHFSKKAWGDIIWWCPWWPRCNDLKTCPQLSLRHLYPAWSPFTAPSGGLGSICRGTDS